jgi:glutathione S-transferase
MLTLYHCHNARSFRPLWTLEEMDLPFELKMLPFPPRELAPDYLAVNPLGTIPTLLDGSMRMTESVAICQYLVSRYGPSPLNVEPIEPDFGPYLNWLHFGEATLTFPQTVVLRYSLFAPPERRSENVAADYKDGFCLACAVLTSSSPNSRRCAPAGLPWLTFPWALRCCWHSLSGSTQSLRRLLPRIGNPSKREMDLRRRWRNRTSPAANKALKIGWDVQSRRMSELMRTSRNGHMSEPFGNA